MKKFVILIGMFLYSGFVFCSGSLDANFGRKGVCCIWCSWGY